MSSSDEQNGGKDPVKVSTMTSDLRTAWIDLLGARCATDRLRLRYTAQDMARFGERSTLAKSLEAIGAMCEYFTEVSKHISPQS